MVQGIGLRMSICGICGAYWGMCDNAIPSTPVDVCRFEDRVVTPLTLLPLVVAVEVAALESAGATCAVLLPEFCKPEPKYSKHINKNITDKAMITYSMISILSEWNASPDCLHSSHALCRSKTNT